MRNLKLRITGWSDLGDESEDELIEDLEEDSTDFLAFGTYIGPAQRVYQVTIAYRDPPPSGTQEELPARLWKLEISAVDEAEAKRRALKDFRLVESISNGRWRREVVRISTCTVD